MITLEQLWDACDRIAADRGARSVEVLQPAGIYLVRPLERFQYDRTPTNSLTFAHTGMDGEHFGMLGRDPSRTGSQPVVMTVPMAFREDWTDNLVIAEDLEEFLRLGCQVGWWYLPDILMRGDRPDGIPAAVRAAYAASSAESPEANSVLLALRQVLGLSPVPLNGERLVALQAKYGPSIEIDPPRHR